MANNDQVLSIRFVGAELNEKGVPIYDLAQSLIALQRIIHKAYLAQEGRLSETLMASKQDRENLALRLGERRRASDEYGLVTFITDPGIQQIMTGVVSGLITGLLLYAQQRSVASRESQSAPPVIFNVSIYNQVVELVNRINGVGGVEVIEIYGAKDGRLERVSLDVSTQNYVRSLKHLLVPGEDRTLVGKLKDMNPTESVITLSDDERTITVSLPRSEFQKIRYSSVAYPRVTVQGRPIYRLGVEGDVFERFDATLVLGVEDYFGDD